MHSRKQGDLFSQVFPYVLKHLFVEPMIRRSGKILNIASTAGFQPGPHMAVFCNEGIRHIFFTATNLN